MCKVLKRTCEAIVLLIKPFGSHVPVAVVVLACLSPLFSLAVDPDNLFTSWGPY